MRRYDPRFRPCKRAKLPGRCKCENRAFTRGNSSRIPESIPPQPKPESTEGERRVSVLKREEGAPALQG